MPKVSKEHSASQRKAILDAAIRCFAKRGFHRATMRDVLRESGMSSGAFYLYFKSKDELIEAIAESRHLRERDLILSTMQKDDLAERFQALIQSFANTLTDREERQERRLGIQLWAESLLDPKIRASILTGIEVPIDLLTKSLESAKRKGRLSKSIDCRALSRVLVALYQGLVLQVAWNPNISLGPQLAVIQSMLLALIPEQQEDAH